MESWKTLCTLIVDSKANWYASDPTLAKISNGPQYLGANFEYFSSIKELLLEFTLYTHDHPPGIL